jgi:hypothetical protein
VALEREIETFRRELPRLLAEGKENKFAVVRGDQVAGTYDTYEQAVAAGYDQFNLDPFMVKKVEKVETIKVFTKNIRPCPT